MKSGSLFLLLAERIDRTHGLGRQSVEQVRGLGHRSLDVAGELGEQLRARLEVCQLLGTFSIVDGAISEAALDDQCLIGLGEVTQGLRSFDEVTLHEGHSGRTGEELIETFDASFLGCDANQRVLSHSVGSIAA